MADTSSASRLLRQLREERGSSLRDAAQELGVAASHLSRLERGEKAASDALRRRAARYYGVSEDIISLEEGRAPADIVRILRTNPDLLDDLRARYGSVDDD